MDRRGAPEALHKNNKGSPNNYIKLSDVTLSDNNQIESDAKLAELEAYLFEPRYKALATPTPRVTAAPLAQELELSIAETPRISTPPIRPVPPPSRTLLAPVPPPPRNLLPPVAPPSRSSSPIPEISSKSKVEVFSGARAEVKLR